jgi:hypothetical protein
MKFYRAYVQFLNFAVRLFGALALLVGIVSLGCAYAFTENRGTRVVAGIFLVAIGVAVFLAKPITVEADARDRPDRVATCGSWTRPNVAVLNSLIERQVRLPGYGHSATRPANLGQWRVKTALPLAGVVAALPCRDNHNGHRMQIQGRYRATVPLIQQAALEIQIMNAGEPTVAAEWALATTRRRLAAYPESLAAVLHTARALRRSPDMVSVRDVTAFGGSN